MRIKRIAVASLAVSLSLAAGLIGNAFTVAPEATTPFEASFVASAQELVSEVNLGETECGEMLARIDDMIAKIDDRLDAGATNEVELLEARGDLLDARAKVVCKKEHVEGETCKVCNRVEEQLSNEETVLTGLVGEQPIMVDPLPSTGGIVDGGFAPMSGGHGHHGGGGHGGGGHGGGGGGGISGGGGFAIIAITAGAIAAVADDNSSSNSGPVASNVLP